MDIKQLEEKFTEATGELKSLIVEQDEVIKSHGGTTTELRDKVKAAERNLESYEKAIQEKMSDAETRIKELEKKSGRLVEGSTRAVKMTAGESFLVSEAYKSAQSRGSNSTDRAELKSLFNARTATADELKELKALTGDVTGSGEALIQPERDMNIYRGEGRRINHIRELMGVEPTVSNAIEFIQHTQNFPKGGPQSAEFAAKLEQALQFELKTSPVQTIAHWIPASRQVLQDAAMLRAYIDNELMHGLMLEEDNQVLYGDGTGGTLAGLLDTGSGIQDVGDRVATDNRLDHVRKAFRDARLKNFMANGVLLNPTDWAEIELLKDDQGQYLYAVVQNVQQGAAPTVWRVPVVETNAINEGEFLTGDFQRGAYLWDRQQSNIRVSESHADYFVKNGVAILAEERLALTINRPQAFVKGSFAEAI